MPPRTLNRTYTTDAGTGSVDLLLSTPVSAVPTFLIHAWFSPGFYLRTNSGSWILLDRLRPGVEPGPRMSGRAHEAYPGDRMSRCQVLLHPMLSNLSRIMRLAGAESVS